MAEIKPFQGFLYNKEKHDVSKEITLPYDKISPEQQKKYYETSETNLVHVILGLPSDDDNDSNNKYTRARDYFDKWIKNKDVIRDNALCLYIYDEEFLSPLDGKKFNRTGLISMLKLEEFDKGIVLPHEKTLSKPKADRLDLIRKCNRHFGQIFGLYKDESFVIENILFQEMKKDPYYDIITKEEHIRHRLWRIENPDTLEKIIKEFKNKKVYIADGHHRYETGINFRNEMREKYPKQAQTGAFNYILMTLVNYKNKGLVVLPTHRVLEKFKNIKVSEFISSLEKYFSVKRFSCDQKDLFLKEFKSLKSEMAYGLKLKQDDKYYLLTLTDDKYKKELNVKVLHELILGNILGITEKEVREEAYIKYVRLDNEALGAVENKEAEMVFLLKPIAVKQVLDISDKKEVMPQKSTDFYPKLYTGIVMSDFLGVK